MSIKEKLMYGFIAISMILENGVDAANASGSAAAFDMDLLQRGLGLLGGGFRFQPAADVNETEEQSSTTPGDPSSAPLSVDRQLQGISAALGLDQESTPAGDIVETNPATGDAADNRPPQPPRRGLMVLAQFGGIHGTDDDAGKLKRKSAKAPRGAYQGRVAQEAERDEDDARMARAKRRASRLTDTQRHRQDDSDEDLVVRVLGQKGGCGPAHYFGRRNPLDDVVERVVVEEPDHRHYWPGHSHPAPIAIPTPIAAPDDLDGVGLDYIRLVSFNNPLSKFLVEGLERRLAAGHQTPEAATQVYLALWNYYYKLNTGSKGQAFMVWDDGTQVDPALTAKRQKVLDFVSYNLGSPDFGSVIAFENAFLATLKADKTYPDVTLFISNEEGLSERVSVLSHQNVHTYSTFLSLMVDAAGRNIRTRGQFAHFIPTLMKIIDLYTQVQLAERAYAAAALGTDGFELYAAIDANNGSDETHGSVGKLIDSVEELAARWLDPKRPMAPKVPGKYVWKEVKETTPTVTALKSIPTKS